MSGTVTAMHASLLNLGIVAVTTLAGRFLDALRAEFVVSAAVLGMSLGLLLLLTIPSATPRHAALE